MPVLLLSTLMCRLAHPNGKSASSHIVVDLPRLLTSLEPDLRMGGDLNCILSSEHSTGTRILAQPLPWLCNLYSICLDKHSSAGNNHTFCTVMSRGMSGFSSYGKELDE